MRKLTAKVLIATCLAYALFTTIGAQGKPKQNERGYWGPVLSVRTEKVKYERENGKIHRGKRMTDSIERFNKAGLLQEETDLSDDGTILSAYKHSYDSRGRLIESTGTHSKFFNLPDKKVYGYDARGNLVEENGYDLNGKLVNRDEYVYNEKNKRIRWTSMSYHPEESARPHQWSYDYDEYGRLKEERAYSDDGTGFMPTDSLGGPHRRVLIYNAGSRPEATLRFNVDGRLAIRETTTYDLHGNELETIEYDSNGLLKEKTKYEYRYDRYGNSIEECTYEWVNEGDRAAYFLTEISYQVIRYRS